MCGIAGIVVRDGMADPASIQAMTRKMSHRGPDADGHWVNGRVALGHRRLSIIDLSQEANQPFFSEDGRYVIVYNGEIYNYREVNAMLRHKHFRTSSDTETILHAYTEWGLDCLSRLKGMFAIAIWDNHEQKLTLVRDRFGVKPLYYAFTGDSLVFASEVRALMASGKVSRSLSEGGLYEYLKFQSVGYPYTLVKGVEQLAAGEYLVYEHHKISKGKYWDVFDRTGCEAATDIVQVRKDIRQLLLQSIERRLVADVPVGAFLSGGIDSSAVVGLMSQVSRTPVQTFNIYFDEPAYDERQYAELVARKFGTAHQGIRMQPSDFLTEVDSALAAMDTPSADGINTYVVSKAIRNAGITVALSGLGGDELFAGYPIFRQYRQLRKLAPYWGVSAPARAVLSRFIGGSNKKERLNEILALQRISINEVYPVSRALLSDQQVETLTRLSPGITGLEQFLESHAAEMAQFPEYSQVTLAELSGYTQQTLLKDTDQMSMAVALEVREPFFDDDLIRYVLAIPDSLKKPAYPKQLLVESLGDLLPNEIVHRKKKGFSFPWKEWMRNQLEAFCTERIRSMSERSFMKGGELNSRWADFLKGDESMRWAEFWAFVVLEDWLTRNEVA